MPDVNWLAVVVAAVSAFVLGGIWYGPLFKKTWCREAGVDMEAKGRHPAAVFGGAPAVWNTCMLVFQALLLAGYLYAHLTTRWLGARTQVAVHVGLLSGVCFVATSFGINYLFAGRSLKLWLIDAGYHVLQFTLYGLIIGLL